MAIRSPKTASANPGVSARLAIKVVPGSSREGIDGWLGDRLKVRVRQPPHRGKANAAVERILAVALQCPRHCVAIVAGAARPTKTVQVTGLSLAEVCKRLDASGS